jgi:hypothetical protein
MARETFRKVITSDETWELVNVKNKKLIERFLKEKTTRCSTTTIRNYTSDLHIFFTWNYIPPGIGPAILEQYRRTAGERRTAAG